MLINIIKAMEDEKVLKSYNHLLELEQNELVIARLAMFENEKIERGL